MKSKNTLLNTKMTALGLGEKFNKWFKTNDPLLKDFIKANPFLRRSYDRFVTTANPNRKIVFGVGSVYWKTLETFLVERGFNHKDWLMFLPKIASRNGTRPNFLLASKDQLKRVPISYVMQIVRVAFPFSQLLKRVTPIEGIPRIGKEYSPKTPYGYQSDYLTIEKVLGVDRTVLPKFDTYEFEKMRPTLLLMKHRLKELGFTKEDGPFMKLPLSKKTEASYIDSLVNIDGFSKEEATTAVKIGIHKKWIRVD